MTPPKDTYRQLVEAYGSLPYGLYFETDAKEWEEHYFPTETVEDIFGSAEEFYRAVQEGCFYMAGAPTLHEEIAVLLCYSSEDALRLAGQLSGRDKNLRIMETAEGDALNAIFVCHGRRLLYCRLKDAERAREAMDSLDY